MSTQILIVDDEIGMQVALREVLNRLHYETEVAPDALQALKLLEKQNFDLVLTDVRMPEMSGLELLDRIRNQWPQTLTLVMTAYGTIEDAVKAMKQGAADYLLKPFSSETIERTVKRLLAQKALTPKETEEKPGNTGGPSEKPARTGPIAVSDKSRQLFGLARQVADSVATVLVQGESGTGKEIIARYIHDHSGRKDRPFVAVNCAALPENLLESELFGHEKGAFTGAIQARKGKFELANQGTILLDEVSEMPLPLQAKLLRVLQEKEIDPVGAQKPVPLDVRVIATTNRNLAAYVEEGHFREDLFYRLQVITLEVPPLRSRKEDILALSECFIRRHCRSNRRPFKRMAPSMIQYLMDQPWRGNVRELENFLERAILLCQDEEITPEKAYVNAMPGAGGIRQEGTSEPDRPFGGSPVSQPDYSGEESPTDVFEPGEIITLEEMEKRLILQTLDQVNGNRTRAADLLGVSVRTIRNKLNQYGLNGEAYESGKALAAV